MEMLGGKCNRCGYDKCLDALQFHHKDKSKKEATISWLANRSFERVKKEALKCELLCANCHAEEHADKDRFKDIKRRTNRKGKF